MGSYESADANEIYNNVGQLWVQTDGNPILASYPIPLDVVDVQSLVASGSHVGIVTTMLESLVQFYSKEYFRISSRPALHLTLAYPPSLVANSLALNEGESKTVTAGDLSATDPDSDEAALIFHGVERDWRSIPPQRAAYDGLHAGPRRGGASRLRA